ncbi:MAG TPA: FapA family protein [Gallionella sp.]|nr:FapA family protein [Gallionella sp.]
MNAMPDDALRYLTLRLDEAEKKVVAAFAPEGAVEPVTLDDLKQAIDAAGFGGYFQDELALANALSKYNSGIAFEIVVARAVDGKFSITFSDDQLSAYLSCQPPAGGEPVRAEEVIEEAKRKGITVELDMAAIERSLPSCEKVLIASGKMPEHGLDGRIENLIPFIGNRSPHVDKDGLADFRELGDVPTVAAGDALVRHIPPTPGVPGMTLSGKTIPARQGKDIAFAARLDGVAPSPDDPNVLVATINGFPVQKKNEVHVEPIYTVQDVDLHTGNISFDGTIHVTGDVHTGMKIESTGDIHVDGTVEGAVLDAVGDISVKGGILGLSEDNTQHYSMIKCGGSCTTRFAQNAHISAGAGIFIHDYAMQSELRAGHQILVGDQGSRRGDLIGGVAHAAMLVKAHVIGAESFVRTVVVAGADQQLHESMKIVREHREAAEHKLADLIKLLELARQHPGRLPPAMIETAEATREATLQEIEALGEDEKELQAEIDLTADAQVVAEKKIYPGADVRFGLIHNHIDMERQGGVFQMKEGELVFE